MNQDVPTSTVTFLFTDIEGSTKLAQEYPDTWEEFRKHHNVILRHSIEGQNGYVFRIIGDAFCAAFSTAIEALRAALKSQIELNDKIWDGPIIKVRMGIHTGQAEIQEDGEYLGYLTLARVQRVMSAAYGGQILLSNPAAELVRNDLPENVSLLDMGENRLKGLQQLERLWQVNMSGLRQDFPPLPTLNHIANNLPIQLTSLIGREEDVETIRGKLSDHHLLTLTGPGGVGKTRLSLAAASELVNDFQHGVWFVELAHITNPAQVAATIAHTLGIQETGGRAMVEALKDYFRDKELLLILDNFEQVIEAATLVKELLLAARNLKVMVSSRAPLRVAGEYEYRVPFLALPEEGKALTLEELAQLGAVRLFIERAKSAKADFALTVHNAAAVAEVCLRLDGLPLAIELAAARIRVLPAQKMLRQLDKRLNFLASSARDRPARQQTLRAAIGWSFDLLTPSQQSLFRQLAVFVGGATYEAIEQVCNVEDSDLLTHLESLLDQSLMRVIEQGGEVRYGMLETIRDFAEETLIASGEAVRVQHRYLSYFHQLATLAESEMVGPEELTWMVRLTDEYDNLRAAVLWGVEHELQKAAELLCDLALFWSRAGHNEEVIGWLQIALSKPTLAQVNSMPAEYLNLRGRALLTLGILMLQQGYLEATPTLDESISILRQVDNKTDLAVALAFAGYLGDLEASDESVALARMTNNRWILAYCLVWRSQAIRSAGGDLELARRSAAEGAKLSREIGSVWAVARSVFSQGQLAVALGEMADARAHLRECVELFSQSQDAHHANLARTELAHVERQQGNYAQALQLYKTAMMTWQDLGLQATVAQQFEYLAMITAAQGQFEHAIRLAGAANKLRKETNSQLASEETAEYEEWFQTLPTQVKMRDFEVLLREGQNMTTSEAVAYALALPQ